MLLTSVEVSEHESVLSLIKPNDGLGLCILEHCSSIHPIEPHKNAPSQPTSQNYISAMALDFQCSFQVPAFVTAIIAWLLSFAALLTPAWQVVYARELQQWIQSGLWMNCQTRPSGMYTCTYTFDESDFNFYTSAEIVNWRTPPFYAWQRRLLIVYLIGQFIAFISIVSFCCGLQPAGRRISAVVFIAAISIALCLHAGCTVVFTFFSQLVEYRFYHVSVSGIYEKHRGYSYYIEIFAVVFYFISLLFAIVHLITSKRLENRFSNPASSTASNAFKFSDRFVGTDPSGDYRQVESYYYPRPGSSASANLSAMDAYEARYASRALPPLPK
uniref:Clc-like protein n=1 Tax=Panagrellus redivivus TaxID=6233 RepID=A0A7E4W546_PANRE